MKNHFELFQMPVMFEIDTQQLDAAYREVQGRVHPDKFVTATDAEKRVAMQWATRANEAYQTLKNPLKRAMYLCELNGAAVNAENNTSMPPAFLMQQMEWREALDDCKLLQTGHSKIESLEKLLEEVDASHDAALKQIAVLIDVDHNFAAAVGQVRALMFIEKFAQEVQHQLDASS